MYNSVFEYIFFINNYRTKGECSKRDFRNREEVCVLLKSDPHSFCCSRGTS